MTPSSTVKRLHYRFRWRRLWYLYGPTYRNQCLKCGFLAFKNGDEVTESDRRVIASKGQAAQWWQPDDPFDCAKQMWDWNDNPFDVIIREANRPRSSCKGFYPWVHGRSSQQHFKLEDERRTFRQQRWLAWLSFLGGLIGALISAAATFWLIKK